jgi:hypothetical protein
LGLNGLKSTASKMIFPQLLKDYRLSLPASYLGINHFNRHIFIEFIL